MNIDYTLEWGYPDKPDWYTVKEITYNTKPVIIPQIYKNYSKEAIKELIKAWLIEALDELDEDFSIIDEDEYQWLMEDIEEECDTSNWFTVAELKDDGFRIETVIKIKNDTLTMKLEDSPY